MKLKTKIIVLCMASLLGYSLVAFIQFNNSQNSQRAEIRESFSQYGKILESSASQVFYTLYHNVQAFTKSSVFKEKKADEVEFVLNELVNLYQIYDAMIFIDANGTFIAANNIGPAGKKLETAHLKTHNWKNEKWFQDATAGKFSEDMKKKIFGTRVGAFETDSLVKKMYDMDKSGQHFTTVVDDGFGGVLGVLTTFAGARWVEGEIASLENTLKDSGKTDVAINFLSKEGTVISQNEVARKLSESFDENDLRAHTSISNSKFLDKLGWQIVLNMKSDTAFSVITSSARLFHLSLAIGLLIACGVAVWIGHVISKQLKSIADTVFKDSNNVFSASEEIADSSAQLSDASTQQASALQETASSLDEINAMVKQNTELCLESSICSEESKEAAQMGQDAVKRMSFAMNEIRGQNDQIIKEMEANNQEIKAVIKVISEIEQKTRVINDIVFQTKLLSFNASVEAARAGEHGKGFAVVAEEVGNLAAMSGKSAKEISELLTSSLSNVEHIIESTSKNMERLIDNGKIKVEEGMKIVKENETVLSKIFENVMSVNQMIKSVADASQEQATGLQEISKAMNNLDATTQTNTVIAVNSSKSTVLLKEQVGSLKGAAVELLKMVEGGHKKTEAKPEVVTQTLKKEFQVFDQKVVSIKSSRHKPEAPVKPMMTEKKVVGIDSTPSFDDDRFEEV